MDETLSVSVFHRIANLSKDRTSPLRRQCAFQFKQTRKSPAFNKVGDEIWIAASRAAIVIKTDQIFVLQGAQCSRLSFKAPLFFFIVQNFFPEHLHGEEPT